MKIAQLADIHTHYDDRGPKDAPTLLFANSLGTDFRLWDRVIDRLPEGLRLIRYDKRGHGLTTAPEPPYFMGDLVQDAGRLLDHLGVRDVVVVGLSIGGMIAQGLAAERLDLIRAMVVSNTAAKIGTTAMWEERIGAVRDGGVEALADATMERWFGRKFRDHDPLTVGAFRNMMVRQPLQGYAGCAAAIGETDLYESTARLKLPTLGIAGSEDGSTPPDLVRETTELVAGSRFHLIRGSGHLPCVDNPDEYTEVLMGFLKDIGHI
ncbi:3-oxoadipate enol-lactonase [Maritimibacter sp. UBA3975]|uniref:3-oxoadipate enol-lactonase n=1 Tax=Maritimibacter sp. UBA3975 TaxID=1946833 RepID=UPI000C0AE764|nr:3-oxoadipate enol-lactonase [Maritimibacter sp. UBA3975]MAM62319.1 3-oxoadipate enol-lactonase [Maritimibacter sp.]|tara:strand:+ start:4551 stop:5345 length:795 start_codon:yes stop_codon:yes gene_type:complete